MKRLRIPGKLMIAGEYAVLEPHHPSIVVAVNRHIEALIAPSESFRLSLPTFGLTEVPFNEQGAFESDDPRLKFVGAAFRVAFAHLRETDRLPAPFHLTLESGLDDASGRKFGLGSSAAATVAAVASLLTSAPRSPLPDPLELFKLAAIAHFQAQGSGSGADVAASTFGGWLEYTSFNPEWLGDRLAEKPRISQLLASPWPFLRIEPLTVPEEFRLLVGWTGSPASTARLIDRVIALRERDPQAYSHFLSESREAVEALVEALKAGEQVAACEAIERNRKALSTLGAHAGVLIETPALAELARLAVQHGGAGKLSGAGGGDCGVALAFGQEAALRIQEAWIEAGIEPLQLSTSPSIG